MKDSATRRIALVAYHFPPENAAGAARPFRFYRYLPEFGYERRVFTAAVPGPDPRPDVTHVPDKFARVWAGEEKIRLGVKGWAELFFRRYIIIAGVGFNWSRDVAAACERFAAEDPQGTLTVFTTLPPVGCLLAPLWLKRDPRLRIVLDYRDPFSLSPDKASDPRWAWARRIDERALRRADLVIANSDAAAETFRESFPRYAAKVHAIWNGFDPEEAISAAPVVEGRGPVLAHVGSIYSGRSPDAIVAAVERLRAAATGHSRALRVALVGPLGYGARVDASLVERGKAAGWLEFRPEKVPQTEARKLTAEADYLLLLQPQSSIQVPAKLFEYLRIGRPILAYAPKGSAIEWLLERAGIPFRCVYPDEDQSVTDRKVAELVQIPTGPYPASDWFLERFDARNQTRRLTELIEQIPHR